MKTSIDIADDLLVRAKRLAEREGKTLKQVVEEALRRLLPTSSTEKPFRYRPHNFEGEGLQPGIAEGDWETIRDLIYGFG